MSASRAGTRRRGETVHALGHDPFEEVAENDSEDVFVDRALGAKAGAGPAPADPIEDQRTAVADARTGSGGSARERAWLRIPALEDVETPPVEDWADRLLDDETRRRVAAVAHLVEGEAGFDAFGFSIDAARRSLPFVLALYRHYFRVRSHGQERIPVGPVVVAANHGGVLPFDGAMIVADLLLRMDPPRLARTIIDHFAGRVPWVNVFFARMGQIVGTHENFAALLDQGQLVLVFPEGIEGVKKHVSERHRLQDFHVGFVEHALRAQAPIVPAAVLGSDDQAPILADMKPLARLLGLPFLPITPTFPLLGPLGLLPYPVRYEIIYDEPMDWHERFGPEDADDPGLVHALASQVRDRIQSLIDEHG